MLRAYLIELALVCLAIWLLGWGAIKLFYIWRREASLDHQESRRVKRDAEDALDDLDHAVQRAATKGRRRGGPKQRAE